MANCPKKGVFTCISPSGYVVLLLVVLLYAESYDMKAVTKNKA